MTKLKESNKAPEFSLPASTGRTVSLKDFRGKKNVVLYFYPKDATPGCTKEACGFRDAYEKIKRRDAIVLGVSPDPVRNHQKFAAKYGLPFILLSDEDKTVLRAYGVWQTKKLYGREFMGVVRTTFLIGKDGVIKKIFWKVKPAGHETQVREALKSL